MSSTYALHFKKITNVENIIQIIKDNYPFKYCLDSVILSSNHKDHFYDLKSPNNIGIYLTTNFIPSEVSFYWVNLFSMLAERYSMREFHPENKKPVPYYMHDQSIYLITNESERFNSSDYIYKTDKIIKVHKEKSDSVDVYSVVRTTNMKRLMNDDFFLSMCDKIEGLKKSHELALIAIDNVEHQLEDI